MPKRKRLFTPIRRTKAINNSRNDYEFKDSPISGTCTLDSPSRGPHIMVKEMSTARGRLQGALMEVLEPTAEDSDESMVNTPIKGDSNELNSIDSEEEEIQAKPPQRQSYVLKLFDRSVDLSQFNEDSPLYPICRAWIANKPKADYSEFGKKFDEQEEINIQNRVELAGPEGAVVSRIPELLSEQKAANKDNINLNYNYEAVLPSREQLMRIHVARWTAVRAAWLTQSNKAELRYTATQQLLNKLYANAL